MTWRHGVAILGASLAALFILAPTATSQGPAAVRLTLTDVALSPNQVTVRAGETVRFSVTNAGRFSHNVTVAHPGRGIEPTLFGTNLQPGETRVAEDMFPVAGEWEIDCPVGNHKERGMKGTVTALAMTGGLPQTGGLPLAALGGLALAGGYRLWRRRS